MSDPATLLLPRFDTFGDVVLLQGFLAAVQEHWPAAELHMLVRRKYAQLASLCSPRLHWHTSDMEPLTVYKRTLFPHDDVIDTLNRDWTIVVQTQYNRSWLDDEIAAYVTARDVRCVSLHKAGEMVRVAGESVAVQELSHETEKYDVLFRYLTGREARIPKPNLTVPAASDEEASRLLADMGLVKGQYVVCVPGGGLNNPQKLWPQERFGECIERLQAEHGLETLVVGHTTEEAVVTKTFDEAIHRGATPRVWLGNDRQLATAAGVLGAARLYVGTDTGSMHIAQALGVPAVVVYGGWHWPRFAPVGPAIACLSPRFCFNCDTHCMFGNAPCVWSVRTEDVYAAVEQALQGALPETYDTIASPAKSLYSEADLLRVATRFRSVAENAREVPLIGAALTEYQEALRVREQELQAALVGNEGLREHLNPRQQVNTMNATDVGPDAARSEIGRLQQTETEMRERLADSVKNLEAAEERRCQVEQQLEVATVNLAQANAQNARLKIECESVSARLADLARTNELLQAGNALLRSDPFAWLVSQNHREPEAPFIEPQGQPGLVSAIIPVYNGAAFLESAIHSVWSQADLPAGVSLEIVVCDDGSKDTSREIVADLIKQSPVPMRLVRHENGMNRGVSASRNAAVAASQGEFIALLDADDEWLPRKTAVQVEHLQNNQETDALCSYGINCDEHGRTVQGWNGSDLAGCYKHLPESDALLPPYTFELLLKGDPIVNSTVMIRRRTLADVGGYTDVMAHQAEDWLLFLKLALNSPIKLIEVPLMRYRVHSSSYTYQYFTSALAYGARIETIYQLLHWMLQRPQYRVKAEWLYRRHYPALMSARASAYKLIEDYYRHHNGTTAGIEAFEAHLCRVHKENEELHNYRRHIEAQLDVIRRIPGSVAIFHALRAIYRRVRV